MPMDSAKETKSSRRLAAILAADIAGYSGLMGVDEEATVKDLKGHQAVILPMIVEHGGRIIDTAGDGILAEFSSVLNAVNCAVAVQRTMADRNTAIDPLRRMQFRVGINQGDVLADETRIYGDGINVAARLESIAEPGGICISGKVYDEVCGRIDLAYLDIGEQQLKNIPRPVRVYRVVVGEKEGAASRISHKSIPQSLSERPSIAVLPFAIFGDDPEQLYFGDGVVEDIITALSHFRWLFVIARNSSFTYRGRAVDVRRIGRDLGVRYVLQGSVRKSERRVRVTVQLIDAKFDRHIWAERYDRDIGDIFAVQDEIARQVVITIDPAIRMSEMDQAKRKPPESMDAWDHFLRGSYHFHLYSKRDGLLALDHLRRSIHLDPRFAPAHARLSLALTYAASLGRSGNIPEMLADAMKLAKTAVALDSFDASAHAAASYALTYAHQHDAAVEAGRRAVDLNPNYHMAFFILGIALNFGGQPMEALPALDQALHLSPRDPAAWFVHSTRSLAFYTARQFEPALVAGQQALVERPNFGGAKMAKAAILVRLGRATEAARLLREVPDIAFSQLPNLCPFRNFEDFEHS